MPLSMAMRCLANQWRFTELNDGSDTLRLARFKKLPLLYLVNKKKEKRLMFVEDDFFCLR